MKLVLFADSTCAWVIFPLSLSSLSSSFFRTFSRAMKIVQCPPHTTRLYFMPAFFFHNLDYEGTIENLPQMHTNSGEIAQLNRALCAIS